MNIKSSICGIQHTCINFLIFLIITKIECWPVFKQDPRVQGKDWKAEPMRDEVRVNTLIFFLFIK